MSILFRFTIRMVLIVALSAGIIGHSIAQRKTDSLKHALIGKKTDSVYVKTLLAIATAYSRENTDSALHYALKVVDLSQKLNLKKLESEGQQSAGYHWYIKGDYDKSITAFRGYYNIAVSLNDYKGMAIGLNNEANVYIETGKLQEALNNYNKALEISKEIKDSIGIARSYNNISYVNKEIGNYPEAIKSYMLALKIFEGKHMENEMAQCYNNIAVVQYKQKNYESAIAYNLQALDIQTKNDLQYGKAISLELLSGLYAALKQYPEAVAYSKKALFIHESKKDTRQIAINSANLGEMMNRQGLHDSAITYFKQAIRLDEQMGNSRSLVVAYVGCANAMVDGQRLSEAALMLDSAKNLLQVTGKKEVMKDYYVTLSNYYLATNNQKEAFDSYRKYVDIKDSLLNEENTKIISEINTKYETEKRKAQIEKLDQEQAINNLTIKNQLLALDKRKYELATKTLELTEANLEIVQKDNILGLQKEEILRNRIDSISAQRALDAYSAHVRLQELSLKNKELIISRKNTLLIVSLLIFGLILLLGYISYRRYKLKQRNETQALLMEQHRIAAQEVINAEERERKRIAADLHDGVGQIMSVAKMNLSAIQNQLVFTSDQQREIFDRAIKMVDEGCKEVRTISHQMMPNALLKMGLVAAVREFVHKISHNALRIQIHAQGLSEGIEKNKEAVLYRVLQECVQNVIKHAEATQLDISVIKDEDGLSILIEDNGKGFDTSIVGSSEGLGLHNTLKRIEYLNGTIEWSSGIGKGTSVSIHLPA